MAWMELRLTCVAEAYTGLWAECNEGSWNEVRHERNRESWVKWSEENGICRRQLPLKSLCPAPLKGWWGVLWFSSFFLFSVKKEPKTHTVSSLDHTQTTSRRMQLILTALLDILKEKNGTNGRWYNLEFQLYCCVFFLCPFFGEKRNQKRFDDKNSFRLVPRLHSNNLPSQWNRFLTASPSALCMMVC